MPHLNARHLHLAVQILYVLAVPLDSTGIECLTMLFPEAENISLLLVLIGRESRHIIAPHIGWWVLIALEKLTLSNYTHHAFNTRLTHRLMIAPVE